MIMQDEITVQKLSCEWPGKEPLMIAYHDHEWGVPLHDDQKLFEFLILDAAQAGLNWSLVLKKRENYRAALDGFDANKMARYNEKKLGELLQNPGIIRNRLKVNSFVKNAKSFLNIQQEFGAFDRYIWQFVGGRPLQNHWETLKQIPVSTVESDAMSKDLKMRGFSFVGTTICYAFMQAAGMVNDHLVHCFRYEQVAKMAD
jgi:DNA-3-methyladenine glycosylase I